MDPELQFELLQRLQYLKDEGFVCVEYDPDHPDDLLYASVREKTAQEIQFEIDEITRQMP